MFGVLGVVLVLNRRAAARLLDKIEALPRRDGKRGGVGDRGHLRVLESARLVVVEKQGRERSTS